MTRFQVVGEQVDYEVAQHPIYAVRTFGDDLNPTADELKVFSAKTVFQRLTRSTSTTY